MSKTINVVSSSFKTIAFLGATGGCGLSALERALTAGSTCIALCRTTSKLTEKFPTQEYPNLHTVQGNAKDPESVAKILVNPADPKRLVDLVVSSIGGAFLVSKMTIDDPHVCEEGMSALLKALAVVRSEGAEGNPKLVAISSTGISKNGRDIPIMMVPLYQLLKGPHADKVNMEQKLAKSGEEYVVVRASLLVDGLKPEKQIRVGIDDLEKNVYEKKEVGYTISREDTGRWIYENLIETEWRSEYCCKAVSITN